MSFEFYIGVTLGITLGVTVTYIICEVRHAFSQPDDVQTRLSRCTLEVVKRDAKLDLDTYTDEELVRAIAAGVKTFPRRDPPNG